MVNGIIRCIAIDDEPWALALITDYIKKVPFLELSFQSTSGIEALQFFQKSSVDLIFLDIQMPDLTGIQIIQITGNQTPVILTTAYSEYALQGYEHNVIDYLLKPISFDRFYKAAEKARMLLMPREQADEIQPVVAAPSVPGSNFIFIKTDNKIVKIFQDDILYIEGLRDYIVIHTPAKKIIALETLKAVEEKLSATQFIRVHKSYIVSLEQIDSIERNRIFIGKDIIPVGDTYKDHFFRFIKDRHLG